MEEKRGYVVHGFATESVQGSLLVVREQHRAEVITGLTGVAPAEPAGQGGRKEVYRFAIGDGHAILRHYQRGGIVRLLFRDAFLLVNRPLKELRVHEYLFQEGLDVPEPLGVSWRRRGLLVRGAIATREVGAVHLQQYLENTDAADRGIMTKIGSTIRRMHDLGVYHADLQIRNILVASDGVFLIDFDKACRCQSVSSWARARNLLRLRRSFEKNGVPEAHYEAIRAGYGDLGIPAVLDSAYRLRGKLSDMFRRH